MQNFCKLKLFLRKPNEVFRQPRLLSQGFLPLDIEVLPHLLTFTFLSLRQIYFKIAKCTFLAKVLKRQLAKYCVVYA